MELLAGIVIGICIVTGFAAILNMIFMRIARKVIAENSDDHHREAVEHWERLEDVWLNIADEIRKLQVAK